MGYADNKDNPEVADIFRKYGNEYISLNKLPLDHLKVIGAITKCRTAALGGHIDECDECGHLRISYNSCRNRHCPKCQFLPKEKWLIKRTEDLLPVSYFHLVFTIPSELNRLVLQNRKMLYNILFKAAKETVMELSRDKKHIGAETGIIAVLHTWGQNLMEHPHLHCIVPGGGLSGDTDKWRSCKKDFFIHVNILSRKFRGKFLDFLKRAYNNKELKFEGQISTLGEKVSFQKLLDKLYYKEWVVYAKKPFGGPAQVLKYLGRYTHRVAISNERILNIDKGLVTFRWKDYRDKSKKKKEMIVTASEFIRRFLLHVLPSGFCKIRYYGIFSNRNRKTKLERCKTVLKVKENKERRTAKEPENWKQLLFDLTGYDVRVCRHCGKGHMHRKDVLYPELAPPGKKQTMKAV